MIIFKTEKQKSEWSKVHPKVRQMINQFAQIFILMQADCEVTSLLRMPNEIAGESGVHATGRAGDIVPKAWNHQQIDMSELGPLLEKLSNLLNPRTDGKPSCLWHDGTGWHFHVQTPSDQNFKDLMGA